MKLSSTETRELAGGDTPAMPAGRSLPEGERDAWQEQRERIALTPESGTVRGLFFRDILRLAPQLQATRARYLPFTNYPMREYMALLLDGARGAFPGAPPAAALRRMGHGVYQAFASSMAGSALFGMIQHEYVRLLELTPKAYPLTMDPGRVEVHFKSDTTAVVQLRDVWPFPESFHLGIWEGAYKALEVSGDVRAVALTRSSADLHLTWDLSTTRGAPYSQR
jgi:uncharacterized protein (TIGR02265 family)